MPDSLAGCTILPDNTTSANCDTFCRINSGGGECRFTFIGDSLDNFDCSKTYSVTTRCCCTHGAPSDAHERVGFGESKLTFTGKTIRQG